MPIRAQAAGSLVSPHLASGRMRATAPARRPRTAQSRPQIARCRCEPGPIADCRGVAEPMLRAANERYRVYTVDEFLEECLGDGDTSPPAPGEVSVDSVLARRRDWGARLLGAAMLFASVGTVAGLVGADLRHHTAGSRRARSAHASLRVRARQAGRGSVGAEGDSRPARAAEIPVSDAHVAPRQKPSIVSRTGRARVRRIRARGPAPSVSRRVTLPAVYVQPPPRSARPLVTAAASVAASGRTPRRSSAEFGFER
jgi:hypothetical protein